jgi:hypothetical protein
MTFHVEDSPDGHVFFEFRVPSAAEAKRVLLEAGCTVTKEDSERSFLVADPYGLRFHVFE